ncbi:MAG: hypothetical protein JXA90_15110, partial [Planctomycetes bacterium]|nr:hypothetical protein [Planctomycetota bacterium]
LTKYWVGVRTTEETNDQGPTPLLIVWPSPEKVAEFAGKTYSQVCEALKYLREGEDYVAADFGTFLPRREEKYFKVLEGEALHRHSSGKKGFVYTTIGDQKGVQIQGEFTAYVMIFLERDEVIARFVDSGQSWK